MLAAVDKSWGRRETGDKDKETKTTVNVCMSLHTDPVAVHISVCPDSYNIWMFLKRISKFLKQGYFKEVFISSRTQKTYKINKFSFQYLEHM